ncbi:hypothetical protein MP228_007107 [Amoeboaphelidium protococcarum]|nr:hypothetical protein MP228_007107 [Amoeboaphelidium protococcarum]
MALGYFRLRKIIPSNWKTQNAKSPEEARQRVIWLYRQCLRYSPEIQSLYPLDIPIYQMRAKFRAEFDKNKYVSNLSTINMLLGKGQMELEEFLYMWKTQGSAMDFFVKGEGAVPEDDTARAIPQSIQAPNESKFLRDFYND